MGVPKVRPTDWQVLQVVHRLGAVPQHKLAEVIGRTRSTINAAVQRLLASGWIVRAGQTGEGRGRPAILLAVNRSLGCFAGVDIASEDIRIAIVGADGTLLDQAYSVLGKDRSPAAVVDQIDLTLRGLLSRLDVNLGNLLGIWAGVNGAVDDHGSVVTCASLGWRNEPLHDRIAARYGCEVLVQGSAGVMNAAAESLMGAGREADSLVYYHVGRGIRARLLQRGRPLAGATARAGEIGHMVVAPDGPQCVCGNRGCLEAVASGPAIVNAIRSLPRSKLPEELRRLLRQRARPKPPRIVQAAFEHADAAGDGPLSQTLAKVTQYVTMGAAMAVAAYDPEVFVLGGYVFEDNPRLLQGVRGRLETMVLDWGDRNLRVVEGQVLSQDRAVAGAAEICQRFWANPRGVLVPA